jgi:hypothetical protein
VDPGFSRRVLAIYLESGLLSIALPSLCNNDKVASQIVPTVEEALESTLECPR